MASDSVKLGDKNAIVYATDYDDLAMNRNSIGKKMALKRVG